MLPINLLSFASSQFKPPHDAETFSTTPKHISIPSHTRAVVTCLLLTPDRIIASSDNSLIAIHSLQTGALIGTLQGHLGGVWALERDGNVLISASTDRTVRIWNIEELRCTHVFYGHTSTARCLKLAKWEDGGEMRKVLVSGSRDSTGRIWRLPTEGEEEYCPSEPPEDLESYSSPFALQTLAGHTHSIRALAVHGSTCVSGSYDCTLRIWDLTSGECRHVLEGHEGKIYSVLIDGKRERVISGGMDKHIRIWSMASGGELLSLELEGTSSLVGLMEMSADGDTFVAGTGGNVLVCDAESGIKRGVLKKSGEDRGSVTCLATCGDLVLAGVEGEVDMWSIGRMEKVRELWSGLIGIWQVAVEGRRVVAACMRESRMFIEVLDFGAEREGVDAGLLGKRIVVDKNGDEIKMDDDTGEEGEEPDI